MPDKFRIYTTEIAATLDPDNAVPAPATLIVFDQDPIHANYNPVGSGQARGSAIRTLGGVVIQDFGVNVKDETISFSEVNAISQSVVTALKTAYETVSGQWYFTDGYECWKVQFSRNPRGFRAWRSLLFSYHNHHVFSYEIQLIVVSKEI
jgi:hypothetical protein